MWKSTQIILITASLLPSLSHIQIRNVESDPYATSTYEHSQPSVVRSLDSMQTQLQKLNDNLATFSVLVDAVNQSNILSLEESEFLKRQVEGLTEVLSQLTASCIQRPVICEWGEQTLCPPCPEIACPALPEIPKCPDPTDCKCPTCPSVTCPEFPEIPSCPEAKPCICPEIPAAPPCPEAPSCICPELPSCPEIPTCPKPGDCVCPEISCQSCQPCPDPDLRGIEAALKEIGTGSSSSAFCEILESLNPVNCSEFSSIPKGLMRDCRGKMVFLPSVLVRSSSCPLKARGLPANDLFYDDIDSDTVDCANVDGGRTDSGFSTYYIGGPFVLRFCLL